jgi:hypothetical protein
MSYQNTTKTSYQNTTNVLSKYYKQLIKILQMSYQNSKNIFKNLNIIFLTVVLFLVALQVPW